MNWRMQVERDVEQMDRGDLLHWLAFWEKRHKELLANRDDGVAMATIRLEVFGFIYTIKRRLFMLPDITQRELRAVTNYFTV